MGHSEHRITFMHRNMPPQNANIEDVILSSYGTQVNFLPILQWFKDTDMNFPILYTYLVVLITFSNKCEEHFMFLREKSLLFCWPGSLYFLWYIKHFSLFIDLFFSLLSTLIEQEDRYWLNMSLNAMFYTVSKSGRNVCIHLESRVRFSTSNPLRNLVVLQMFLPVRNMLYHNGTFMAYLLRPKEICNLCLTCRKGQLNPNQEPSPDTAKVL